MTFRMYDTSADQEAVSEASYSIGDGTFGYGQFSALSLMGTIYKIQEVALEIVQVYTFERAFQEGLIARFTLAQRSFGFVSLGFGPFQNPDSLQERLV